jgi:predicted nucleic acid-binding protein
MPRLKGKKKTARVLVQVSPEMSALIKELAMEANISTSQLIGDMIEQARPAFEQMLAAIKSLKEERVNEAYNQLQRAIVEVQRQANDAQLDMLDNQSKAIAADKDK